jgi:hypothetical protein
MKGRAPPRSLRIARKGRFCPLANNASRIGRQWGSRRRCPTSAVWRFGLLSRSRFPRPGLLAGARRAQKEGSAGAAASTASRSNLAGGDALRPPARPVAPLRGRSAAGAAAALPVPPAPRGGAEKSALGTAARARGSSPKEARRGGRRPEKPRGPPPLLPSRAARGFERRFGLARNAGSFYR